jgi:hypothetical protein
MPQTFQLFIYKRLHLANLAEYFIEVGNTALENSDMQI